jgi:hypothetical protein
MTALPENTDELTALLADLDEVESPKTSSPEPLAPSAQVQEPEEPDSDETIPEHQEDALPTEEDLDLQKIYSGSINELLANYRKDRKDIDGYIKFIYSKLKKQEPSRVFYEALAMALRTKSEANSNLIKLIDNVSKRLEKSNGSMGDLDLESLLDE